MLLSVLRLERVSELDLKFKNRNLNVASCQVSFAYRVAPGFISREPGFYTNLGWA